MPEVDKALSPEECKAYKDLIEVSEEGEPTFKKPLPASLDEASLLTWLKDTWNAISNASKCLKSKSVSTQLSSMSFSDSHASMISENDETSWFASTQKPLHGAAESKRKMDFGMLSLGPSGAQASDEEAEWSKVEVVSEVTNQVRLDNEKILQFCD